MEDKLSAEEVAILIHARRLLKDKGLASNTDIKTICKHAGVSRKTGYQWEKQHFNSTRQKEEDDLRGELEALKRSHSRLEKEFDDVRFENEGRKVAWEIHEVDKYLVDKKNTTNRAKRKK